MSGLLIVNADDFGGGKIANERIVECFASGAITSTSAMVYMRGSATAAALARGTDMAIGLHLNLTQPYDAPSIPADVRDRQQRVSRQLAKHRHRYMFDPSLFLDVRRCIDDQMRQFLELFDKPPTHLDGHNHGHLSLTALIGLPREIAVRTAEDNRETGAIGRLARASRRRLIARHPTTEHFFAIARVQPERLRDTGEDPLLALSKTASVEIMTHPDRDWDYALLGSSAWQAALRSLPTGSFAQLRT